MSYVIKENKIIVFNKQDFNPKHILECGQIFTYIINCNGNYEVYSKCEKTEIFEFDDRYELNCTNADYFVNFFDLEIDYGQIKKELNKTHFLQEPIKFGYGIRILNQDLLETIISFVISANNNIKRITKSMQQIRQYGKNKGSYYAFPTLDELALISEQQFKDMGTGYRSSYLVKLIEQLKQVDLEQTKLLSTPQLKKWLLSLMGVGPKVADCIMLFGYKRSDSFPVDTWLEKVYVETFNKQTSRIKMSQDFCDYFKSLAGYAQQYLFYFRRSQG